MAGLATRRARLAADSKAVASTPALRCQPLTSRLPYLHVLLIFWRQIIVAAAAAPVLRRLLLLRIGRPGRCVPLRIRLRGPAPGTASSSRCLVLANVSRQGGQLLDLSPQVVPSRLHERASRPRRHAHGGVVGGGGGRGALPPAGRGAAAHLLGDGWCQHAGQCVLVRRGHCLHRNTSSRSRRMTTACAKLLTCSIRHSEPRSHSAAVRV